jgi:hypothetical protein
MEQTLFWQIIDAARQQADGDVDEHLAELQEELGKLPEAEIIAFDRIFTAYWARAYLWDLWAAAYIIGGGCSDDGFMDFRGWLIAQGEKVYEAALANPETLAEVVPVDDECQIEGFQYVAGNAWAEKTGQDYSDFPTTGVAIPNEPAGEPWTEDDLERRFPRLWQKFVM